MTTVTFCRKSENEGTCLQSVTIAVRCAGRWIFCRDGEGGTWAMPGGCRKTGETIEAAARRTLREKIGVTETVLEEIGPYRVETDGEGAADVRTAGGMAWGMLYFAAITELPASLAAEKFGPVQLFDALPAALSCPDIQPALYAHVQAWRNTRTGAEELWDVYDSQRNRTGRTQRRGEPLRPGDYHLAVHVWLQDSRGRFLITKRSQNKGYPGLWETTGGAAQAGEDSLAAALREVREETGLTADPACGRLALQIQRSDLFLDVWLFRQNFNLADVVLQEGETCDARYADPAEIRELAQSGRFVPYSYMNL